MTLDSNTPSLLRRSDASEPRLTLRRSDSGAAQEKRRWGLQIFEDEQLCAVVPLERAVLSVGRDPCCLVRLTDRSVSRRHCTLAPGDSDVLVENLSSTNGTFHLGQRVEFSRVREGEEVFLGRALVRLVDLDRGEWMPGAESFDALYRDRSSGLFNPRGFWLHAESRTAMARTRSSRSLLLGRIRALAENPADARLTARIGELVRASLPALAVAGRTAHDEFGLFAIDLEHSELGLLAEQLGRRLRTIVGGSDVAAVTLGGASVCTYPPSLQAMQAAAEDALQRARLHGDGCIVIPLGAARAQGFGA